MSPEPDASPPPDWQIDLHGMSQSQALRRLRAAVQDCRYQRYRHLRVITGRGRGSPAGKSVLLPALLEWLDGPEAHALGVRSASLASTGGAIDVLVDPREVR